MGPFAAGLLGGVLHAAVVVGVFVLSGHHFELRIPGEEVLFFAVSVPFFEELIFRWPVLAAVWYAEPLSKRGLVRSRRLFILLVVLIQGLVFGALHLADHLSWWRFWTAALGGIIYGALAWRYRSFWPGMVAHGVHNFLMMFFWWGL